MASDATMQPALRLAKSPRIEDETMKSLLLLAATATLGLLAVSASTAPASAAGCYYKLYQNGRLVTGSLALQGYGHAVKQENACNRARRECNRKLDRAIKRGEVPRHGPRELRCERRPTG